MAEELNRAILAALAQETEAISLPKLGKRLGLGASVLMRALTMMGDASLGDQPGPGWVTLSLQDERWMASLTEAGRRLCADLAHG
ncbi:hypothetical protein [Rhodoferax sp.]|uniref:hypothetical protein n=1 Tax=Rhodoferax sp. TaxID=50421 RepID=UPI00374CE576